RCGPYASKHTPTTGLYTLSLHDALPILKRGGPFLEGDGAAQDLLQAGGRLEHALMGPRHQAGDLGPVDPQGEAPVLEETAKAAELGAPHQLLPLGGQLVPAGGLKAEAAGARSRGGGLGRGLEELGGDSQEP